MYNKQLCGRVKLDKDCHKSVQVKCHQHPPYSAVSASHKVNAQPFGKDIHIVPVRKKKSRSDVEKYKTVSLLPITGKIMEAIVSKQMTMIFAEHRFMNERQFRFKRGCSSDDLPDLSWSLAPDDFRNNFSHHPGHCWHPRPLKASRPPHRTSIRL